MNKKFAYIWTLWTLALVMLCGSAMGQRPTEPEPEPSQQQDHVIVGGSVFGGGNLASVAGSSTVIINQTAASIGEDVYGGGAKADVNTSSATGDTTGVTLTKGIVTGDVYGGGLGDLESLGGEHTDIAALVNGPVTVVVNGGTARNVFGCNNLNGAPQNTVVVNINGGTILQDVYGGGNLASANAEPEVNINGGTVGRDVYGGGALANVGSTTVNVMGGTVTRDIYGGGLGRKAVSEYVDPDNPTNIIVHGVDGIAAAVNGDVHVRIGKQVTPVNPGDPEYEGEATIGGSVYGCNNLNGSPTGDVHVDVIKTAHVNSPVNNYYPQDANGVPTITLDGLGNVPNPDAESYSKQFAIKAVYGGGNQAHYIPEANKTTTVHVWYCTENTVKTVYGGGNAADVGRTGEGAVTANTHLIIDGGRFDRIFGGGNGYSATGNHTDPYQDNQGACTSTPSVIPCDDYNPGANIYGTATTDIYGGLYRQVFGGSNQYGVVNSTALNIGRTCDTLLIFESFGGANEAVITGNVTTTLNNCDLVFGSFYGGSNLADINGDVTLNVHGGNYRNVFGGSKGRMADSGNNIEAKAANISGDVTLNLYGGNIDYAFGGSDVNGNITGTITVNMLEQGSCGLVVHNVFGGGRDAAYTPNQGITERVTPVVNLIHGRVSKKAVTNGSTNTISGGNVFGGGLGETATVTANPKVVVGSLTLPSGQSMPVSPQVTVDSIVFGGGDAAPVAGSDTVILQQSYSSVTSIFGGGNQASVGNATVDVLSGNVSRGVYGGCNTSGSVGGEIYPYTFDSGTGITTQATSPTDYPGKIAVNIVSNLGSSGSPLTEGVFGGGKGYETHTTGTVTVTIDKPSGENTVAPVIYSDVYGGSAFGQVSASGLNTKVAFKDGELHGIVFGGGKGSDDYSAEVSGNTLVDISGGSIYGTIINPSPNAIYGAVFGGCNVKGVVKGNSMIELTGGTIYGNTSSTHANVYGGGLGENTKVIGDVDVTIGKKITDPSTSFVGNANIYGDVYGGSAKGLVNCNEDGTGANAGSKTDVALIKGSVTGDLYGGGHGIGGANAHVYGSVIVEVKGGAVNQYDNNTKGGNVFGCNNEAGMPQSDVTVNVDKDNTTGAPDLSVANVYGGGNKAYYEGTPLVNIVAGTVSNNVYGGGNNITTAGEGVAGTDVRMTGGTVGNNLYGGCNENGTVKTTSSVVVTNGTVTGSVFGGGLGEHTQVNGKATVHISGTTTAVNEDVFGGGDNGIVNGGTEVLLDLLPSVTTSPVTNIDATTATCGGNVISDGGGGGITERGICYSTSSNPTVDGEGCAKVASGTGTGSFTASVTNLTASTTYHVRSYATNSAGTSYGNEVTFTTESSQPQP